MTKMFKAALAAALMGMTALASPVRADNPAAMTDEEFGNRVRAYLIAHPEVIVEAMETLQTRQEEQQAADAKQAIETNRDKLFNNPLAPVTGPADADVTVVEFFDYNCGYCKRMFGPMKTVMDEDKKLKIVWIEFPILAESSKTAALTALAAHRQGKYDEVHVALMTHNGSLDDDTIDAIAAKAGVDMDRLRKDRDDPELAAHLADNQRLAQELNIRGTPALIVQDELVPGAIDLDQLKGLIAAKRS